MILTPEQIEQARSKRALEFLADLWQEYIMQDGHLSEETEREWKEIVDPQPIVMASLGGY